LLKHDSKDIIGIDLGTSNSALALWDHEAGQTRMLPISQLESRQLVSKRPTLASALYIPRPGELAGVPEDVLTDEGYAIGQHARSHGSLNPDRLVTSAKSWLCQNQIERTAPILPFHAADDIPKVSASHVSQLLLHHLKKSLIKEGHSTRAVEDGMVVLAVPASFDEIARQLTYEAAVAAGFTAPVLIEEPQAALYSYISSHEKIWQSKLTAGDVVVVCDVGGGTTDFTLIGVAEDADGNLELERLSVGEHLLVGGDNMDLALAYTLQNELAAQGKSLDQFQFLSLIHGCREAKELLLKGAADTSVPISIASRSANLFSQTLTVSLTEDAAERLILDGFFPVVAADATPLKRSTVGLRQIGLAYEADAAITRQLAAFLRQSYRNIKDSHEFAQRYHPKLDDGTGMVLPDKILFNGGVFHAAKLRTRVCEVIGSWKSKGTQTPLIELEGGDFDLAVAHGAAYYGYIKQGGKGIRIRSGTARSYYVGIERPVMAVPGMTPPLDGLCVVPQGTEEGCRLTLSDKPLTLVTGEKVDFRFFSSRVRRDDAFGAIVPDAAQQLDEVARLSLTIPRTEESRSEELIPVVVDAEVTEVGTLQFYMKHLHSDKKWNLELNVRNEPAAHA
jgi:hypothetical protein